MMTNAELDNLAESHPMLAELVFDRDRRCVLCDDADKNHFRLHEVVPDSFNKEGAKVGLTTLTLVHLSNYFATLCVICRHKVTEMTSSVYRPILENGLWKSKSPGWAQERKKAPFFYSITKLRRMSHINRFGAEVVMKPENLAEHSWWVAMYALMIYQSYVISTSPMGSVPGINQEKLVMMALFHDLPEILTTDVVSPIKNAAKGTSTIYDVLEKQAIETLNDELTFEDLEDPIPFEKLIDNFNSSMELEAQLVRAADKVAAIAYCIEEACSGNRNFLLVLSRFYYGLAKFAMGDWKVPPWLQALTEDLKVWIEMNVPKNVLEAHADKSRKPKSSRK